MYSDANDGRNAGPAISRAADDRPALGEEAVEALMSQHQCAALLREIRGRLFGFAPEVAEKEAPPPNSLAEAISRAAMNSAALRNDLGEILNRL